MTRAFLLLIAMLVVGGVLVYSGVLGRDSGAAPVEVSAAAAAGAEAKLEALREEGEEARLNDVELTSLLRYRPDLWSFSAVIEPEVALRADTIQLTGSVLTDQLPADAELDQFRFLLPDTTRVSVAGTLIPGAPGVATVQVTSIEAAGMPVPPRYYP